MIHSLFPHGYKRNAWAPDLVSVIMQEIERKRWHNPYLSQTVFRITGLSGELYSNAFHALYFTADLQSQLQMQRWKTIKLNFSCKWCSKEKTSLEIDFKFSTDVFHTSFHTILRKHWRDCILNSDCCLLKWVLPHLHSLSLSLLFSLSPLSFIILSLLSFPSLPFFLFLSLTLCLSVWLWDII